MSTNIGGRSATDDTQSDTIFLTQNAQLFADLGAAVGTTADDRLVMMTVTEFNKVHPMTRFDFGSQAGYGFAAPDVTISATILGSSDLIQKVNAIASRNKVGVIPERLWRFVLINNEGGDQADEDDEIKHLDMTCQVYEFGITKPSAHPGDPVQATVTMIARHRKHPSAASDADIDRPVDFGDGRG